MRTPVIYIVTILYIGVLYYTHHQGYKEGFYMLSKQYERIGSFLFHDVLKIFIVFLCVFIFLGFASMFAVMMLPYNIVNEAVEEIQQGMQSVLSDGLTWGGITIHNIYATLVGTCLGFVPFLFLPTLNLGINSITIGAIMGYIHISGQSALKMFVRGIIPHGIFEIPAVILSCSVGFLICLTLVRAILGRIGAPKVKQIILDSLRTYVLVILPLLIIAGFIEAKITPLLIQL